MHHPAKCRICGEECKGPTDVRWHMVDKHKYPAYGGNVEKAVKEAKKKEPNTAPRGWGPVVREILAVDPAMPNDKLSRLLSERGFDLSVRQLRDAKSHYHRSLKEKGVHVQPKPETAAKPGIVQFIRSLRQLVDTLGKQETHDLIDELYP